MAVLAVVLAGKGIAALQEAGAVPVGPLGLPAIPSLGVYPTWQGVLTQLAVVVLIVGAFAYSRRREPAGPHPRTPHPALSPEGRGSDPRLAALSPLRETALGRR